MLPITRPITAPITAPITGGDIADWVAALFANNEPGFDYDASDRSTLFTDTAGLSQASVEQTVALILDKSRGFAATTVRSAIDQFTFTGGGTTPPTAVSGATTFQGEQCVSVTFPAIAAGGFGVSRAEGGGGAANWSGTPGRYRVSYTVALSRALTAGEIITVYTTGVGGICSFDFGQTNSPTTWTTFVRQEFLNATGGEYPVIFATKTDAPVTVYLRQYTAERINGAHQIQSTPGSRAVLRSRYNQILYSEDFSNAAWQADFSGTGVSATKTPNFGIAPDGTQTATRIQLNKGAGTTASDFARVYQSTAVDATTIRRIWIRTNDATTKTFRLSADGANFTVTGTWTQIADTGSNASLQILLQATTSTDADFLVWRPEAVRSTDAQIPYQRIAAATDYAVGPQFPTYLEYDGVDDSYASAANLDLTGTDKLTVFAAVTKLSDAATGVALEFSADAGTNAGAFQIRAPNTAAANYLLGVRGSVAQDNITATTYAAPVTNVLTHNGDLSAASSARVNGAAFSGAGGTGGGNFGSYPLFLGRRNNATLPFRGRMYRVIGRGATTPVGTIAAVEGALNVQMGKVY